MDSMDERLRDLILYVNQNSYFDIYAVQLKYYKFEQYKIMVPKIFGVEVKKNIISSSGSLRKKWDEYSFINEVKKELKNNADKLIKFYEYLKHEADKIRWGTGYTIGSFSPIFYKIHKSVAPFTIYSNGKISLKLSWILRENKDEQVKYKIDNFIHKVRKKTNIKISNIYTKETDIISPQEFFDNYDIIFELIRDFIKS